MNTTTIRLEQTPNLQQSIEGLWANGVREFELNGVYQPNKSTYALLRIGKQLSGIAFSGSGVLDGGGLASHTVVVEDANATFDGLEIRGGDTTDPARVAKDYEGKSFRSVFEAIDGAGILVLGKSTVRLSDCRVVDNHSGMCGGGLSNQGTGLIKVEGCTFEDNTTYHTGGAIDNLTPGSNISVTNSNFKNNLSNTGSICGGPHGQITVFKNTEASIRNCHFSGAIYAIDAAIGSTVRSSGNSHNGMRIEPRRPGKGGSLVDRLNHGRRLFAFSIPLSRRYGLFPLVRK